MTTADDIFLIFYVFCVLCSMFRVSISFLGVRFTLNRFGTFEIKVSLLHFNFCLCLVPPSNIWIFSSWKQIWNFHSVSTFLFFFFCSIFHFHEKNAEKNRFELFHVAWHLTALYSNIQIICSTRCHRIFSHFPKSKFAFWSTGHIDFVTNTSMTSFIMRLFLYHKLQHRFLFKMKTKSTCQKCLKFKLI